ncbi:MAG: HAMP domain-containing sensor histidine kinase [Chloroflexota bacterium]
MFQRPIFCCLGILLIWLDVLRPSILTTELAQATLTQQARDLTSARDDALQASNIKSQLLMNVSHDARTPLSSIILSADMLRKTASNSLTARQKERLDIITESAKRLNLFLQNLLEQAKLEVGNIQLSSEPIDKAELCDELNLILQPLAESKGLTWELISDASLPTTLHADRMRLFQVITNLAHNAIKFTEQGTVTVHLIRYDEHYWGLRVRDTGQGISQEAQEHIFDAFWQVDGSATRQNQSGVGLGLAIVHSVIDLMGGHIHQLARKHQKYAPELLD